MFELHQQVIDTRKPAPVIEFSRFKRKVFEPRPYQQKAIKEVYEHWQDGIKSVLLVALMGAGKTVMAGNVIEKEAATGHRIMFLVHRNALLDQAAHSIRSMGIPCTIVQGSRRYTPGSQVIVASVQTIEAKLKKGASLIEWFGVVDVVIVDEAHTCAFTKGYNALMDAYTRFGCRTLGLTATPWRLKNTEWLGQKFDAKVEAPQPPELIRMGASLPARVFGLDRVFDLSQVHLTRGEFDERDLEKQAIQEKALQQVLSEYIRVASGRRAIAFCSGKRHANLLADVFNRHGIPSQAVVAETSRTERDEITRKLWSGELMVVPSVDALTAGYDVPPIECILFVTETNSRSRYFQAAGRGSRPCKEINKTDYLVLDFGSNAMRFGSPSDYQDYDISEKPQRDPENSQKLCPSCHAVLRIFASRCPECGHVFTTDEGEQETLGLPDFELVEIISKIDRAKIDFLRKQMQHCFENGVSPIEAADAFHKTYGHIPCDAWYEGLVLNGNPLKAIHKRYEDYLRSVLPHEYAVQRYLKLEGLK